MALIAEAVRQLSRAVSYHVPAQDLTVALDRIPALPKNGFLIEGVRPVAA